MLCVCELNGRARSENRGGGNACAVDTSTNYPRVAWVGTYQPSKKQYLTCYGRTWQVGLGYHYTSVDWLFGCLYQWSSALPKELFPNEGKLLKSLHFDWWRGKQVNVTGNDADLRTGVQVYLPGLGPSRKMRKMRKFGDDWVQNGVVTHKVEDWAVEIGPDYLGREGI